MEASIEIRVIRVIRGQFPQSVKQIRSGLKVPVECVKVS